MRIVAWQNQFWLVCFFWLADVFLPVWSVGAEEPASDSLTVPVFPRKEREETPVYKSGDLRDSYIQLENGSVISMADWILGSLNKDKAG